MRGERQAAGEAVLVARVRAVEGAGLAHLSLTLFGTFEATLDGEPVTTFGSDKARALLAFLAVESNHPHRRERLSGMFWSDYPEKRASHNLSQTLLRLRRALRETASPALAGHRPFLLATTQDIQFDPHGDHDVDVARFSQLLRASQEHHHSDARTCITCARWLQDAAALYRGDLLAGLFPRGSSGFGEWHTAHREMLHRQAVGMLARLTGHHEACGDNDQVLRFAGQLVDIEPWDEGGNLRLIRALARAGQMTSALDRHRIYERVLSEELGIGPSAEATALYEQLRSNRPRKRSGGQSPGETASETARAVGASPGPSLEAQDERRQLTAVICGHRTHTGAALELEDLHRRLAVCSPACQATLERYGGTRQLHQGDDCLIYFVYPQAFEDAAQRAVHAGLALVTQAEGGGSARAGIHTGDMLVRRHGEAGMVGMVGGVPALARACQTIAEPGTVRITGGTERLVRDWFHCRDREPLALAGPGGPLKTYQVLGESGARNRQDCRLQDCSRTRFVGRALELDQLLACVEEMQDGSGRAVLISGEPGIGKSRLLRELRMRSLARTSASATWLDGGCSPYEQHTSLWPVIRLLEQLLGIEPNDAPEERCRRLEAVLARHDVGRPTVRWLLSLLLGLPADPPSPRTITADHHRRMGESALLLLQREAARRPLVVVLEDLHWSDAATTAWLERSLDALAAVPCLLLLTFRPQFVPPWPPRPRALSMVLGPLSNPEIELLVRGVAGDTLLHVELRRRIVRQAEGVPFFAEELTAAVLDRYSAAISASPEVSPDEPISPDVTIPATLRDSLLARLDRSGAAATTARWAAVLGPEFQYSILRAVVPYDEQQLLEDLTALVEANLIKPEARPSLARGREPAAFMSFKHELIREAAYASLPVQMRESLHHRVAETIERRFPKLAENRPELVAQHYAHAGLPSKAVDFWLRAGGREIAQGAISQATVSFEQALRWIAPEDRSRRWQALLGHEESLDLRGEREAQDADLGALMQLADELNDDARQAEAYLRRTAHVAVQGRFGAAIPLAEAAAAAAGRAGDPGREMKALVAKAQALTFSGEIERARPVVEQVLTRVDEIEDDSVHALALTVAARYYRESGDLARSAQLLTRSLAVARRAGDQRLELSTSVNLGLLYATLGVYAEARVVLEAGLARAARVGDRRLHASLMYSLGYVVWLIGDAERGAQLVEEALGDLAAVGDAYARAVCLTFLGYILESLGGLSRAAEHLAEARAYFAEAGMDADRFETQAVEARVALARRQRKLARRLATEVWSYLQESGPQGIDSPSRTYLCVADVLAAVESDSSFSADALAAGHRHLLGRAGMVTDPDLRHFFLENVAENREIMERAERGRS